MLDEVTISHLIRRKNSFTRTGMTYGQLLWRYLEEKSAMPRNGIVLEIGPGLGNIANEFKSHLTEDIKYIVMDISPKIIRNLHKHGFDSIIADCMAIPFKKGSFALVIMNEIISDLPTIVDFDMKTEDRNNIITDARRIVEEHKLRVPKDPFNLNYGALKLIEETFPLVKRGGKVFIAEQSCGDASPQKVPVRGHDEYTIDFNLLENLARDVGFSVERGDINQILGIDEERKFISGLLRPDIREIYNLESDNKKLYELMTGIFTPDEFTQGLVDADVFNVFDIEKYGKFVRDNAQTIGKLLRRFEFMLLTRST